MSKRKFGHSEEYSIKFFEILKFFWNQYVHQGLLSQLDSGHIIRVRRVSKFCRKNGPKAVKQ